MTTNADRRVEPTPPKGWTTSRLARLAVVSAIAGIALGGSVVWLLLRPGDGSATRAATADLQALYQCPMHPTITSDHPGDCPICGMKLVEMKQEPVTTTSPPGPGTRRVALYRSPMDPNETSLTPRQDEMGMDYTPVYEDELSAPGRAQVQGRALVTIDPTRQQLIGLRTASVTAGEVAQSFRTVGRVQVDPTRVRKVNVKIEGYIERLYVDFVGRPVKRGEALFSLFSPSVLAAENEYVLALETQTELSKVGATAGTGDTLVASARRKLDLWDVPAYEIERLERTREPSKTLVFVSPIAGVVTAKNVVEGARLNPGDTPYEITDLGVVWIMADAYETDTARVQVGTPASLTLAAYPGRRFVGEVVFIDPLLDPTTRTAKVHLHFDNPRRELKPGMYGEVTLEGPSRQGLRISADAVLRSGNKDVVFVSLGDGKFEPREVQLGDKNGDLVEVTSGLDAGQEVVTRANFLVDSESQLRASLAAISGR